MLTPNDIQNPAFKSGYAHVGFSQKASVRPYHAQVYGGRQDSAGHAWQGPTRRTALEAAQDYCDYVNGQSSPSNTVTLKTVNHARRDQVEHDEEMRAALGVLKDKRAQRKGVQGHVYLIGELEGWYAVKVGYSVKPEARAGELQTGNPRPLRLLASRPGTESDERALHAKYADLNILGEWFEADEDLLREFGLTLKGTNTK